MNNSLVLAYLGDSVYELYIRKFLITKYVKVNDLQKEAINYVSAKSQDEILKTLFDNNILTDEEIDIVKRARNHKNNHKPKYVSAATYKNATGLEALIGYLYLENNNDRIEEIMNYILESRIC
jgi:ribonuclease-3 family protein